MIVSSRSEPAGQHHAQDAQPQRHLVGDQLGARPQAAEEAVLVVAGPAAQDHAVDGDAATARRRRSCPRRRPAPRPARSARRRPADVERQHAAEGNRRRRRPAPRPGSTIGARMYSSLSTWAGVYSSLKMNFRPSASGCPSPNSRILRQRNADAVRARGDPAPRRPSTARAARGRPRPSSARRSAARS